MQNRRWMGRLYVVCVMGFGSLLGLGCMEDPLIAPTAGVLPLPEDAAQLQALYQSADGLSVISVFPGTTLPAGGLSVETLVADAAGSNSHRVKLGPDGTQFDMPVRVSTLIGGAVVSSDGQSVVPRVHVTTVSNGVQETVNDFTLQSTNDGNLIVHAYLNHFSDLAVEVVEDGLRVAWDSPLGTLEEEWAIGANIPIKVRAQNKLQFGEWDLTMKPTVVAGGALGAITPGTPNVITLDAPNQIKPFRDETCQCVKLGMGTIDVGITGETFLTEKQKVSWNDQRTVKCVDFRPELTVTFDGDLHTTYYRLKVWYLEEGKEETEITFYTDAVKYKWTLTTTCGAPLAVTPVPYHAQWYHEGCSGEAEEASIIKVEVTYGGLTKSYTGVARNGEGGPVIILK